jgi:hypothetical protein
MHFYFFKSAVCLAFVSKLLLQTCLSNILFHQDNKFYNKYKSSKTKEKFSVLNCLSSEGRHSSVGIATGYGLDCPGIESRWGREFPHLSRPAVGSTQPPIQWVPCLSRGLRRPWRGVDHPPPSTADVKERVELYLYSTSGPSWPVIG